MKIKKKKTKPKLIRGEYYMRPVAAAETRNISEIGVPIWLSRKAYKETEKQIY